ncbi:DUF148 domain-containing protein [Spirulina subsalsa FACHB-351]|uniref:DUF148 domain-containing protein n=2 Tax=Spirulina subsalsa TaxID=54311 RepID=A0ABT3L0X5_9CYAN|nr:DUF148 domain-containing protein [Spirulina subsalsa FACHB-351]
MKTVEQLGYRVTVGDVAAKAGLNVNLAQQGLLVLASDAGANLQVSESGEIAYVFPKNFRAILRNKDWKLRWQETLSKIWQFLFYLIRISFGILLIISIVLIVTAIIVILIALNSKENGGSRNSRSSSYGGLRFIFVPRFWYVSDVFWLLNPRANYSTGQQKRYRQRQLARSSQQQEMGFLESVFSFLFGEGDPNYDLEERRWQQIGAVIQRNKGAVIAEQITPYFEGLDRVVLEDESYMLPVLARFNGYPEVSEEGELIYYFPELQVTAKKSNISKPDKYLQEKPWRFSSATREQLNLAGGLGFVNILGGLVLMFLLYENPALVAEIGFLAWINSISWLLLGYGALFLLIPVVRYFWIQRKNQVINQRNNERSQYFKILKNANQKIKQKLVQARQFASQHILSEQDLAYTTETDLLDQNLQQVDKIDEEWRRRLEGES